MNDAISFREGTTADSYTAFALFEETFADLAQRIGQTEPTSWDDPAELAQMWEIRRTLYEHLAATADQFWLAEQGDKAVGFARSIVRGQVRQLTEFFVLPDVQSASVGRELLTRAFPSADRVTNRSIIATTDLRAQARYLKAGVFPRFPIYYFWRQPEPVVVATDLDFVKAEAGADMAILGDMDEAILGFRRESDHRWLLTDRQGYIYYRDNQPVGYGYVGATNGPFALLDGADYGAVLAHAESEAAAAGREHIGMEVPMVNETAVTYLLQRGFQMDSFVAYWMCNRPFGKLEKYIITAPPFFL
jgi:GNAT superfamily N-acetyltransferase